MVFPHQTRLDCVLGAMASSTSLHPDIALVVLCGRDPDALLAAASTFVRLGQQFSGGDPFAGPREVIEVVIPGGDWGIGRRVTVERRYAAGGTMLVRVPEPVGGRPPSSAARASFPPDDEEGRCCSAHAQAQDYSSDGQSTGLHLMRCVGVLEVCKEFAGRWGVDMRRRTAVVHLACRLPAHVQSALGRLAEASHASSLFVLTCAHRSALDARIVSRATLIHVPSAPCPTPSLSLPAKTVASSLASGRTTAAGAAAWMLERLASSRRREDDADRRLVAAQALGQLADMEHALARVRALGGDLQVGRALLAEAFVAVAETAAVATRAPGRRKAA